MNVSGRAVWTVGRDRHCDVVVDCDGVRPLHCQITYDNGTWSVTPKDGSIGVRGMNADHTDWSHESRQFCLSDQLWLDEHTAMPWPSEIGAIKLLSIGRATDCDITIDSQHVSGRHAVLILGPHGTCVIRDANSRNGLFVDADLSKPVSATMLLPDQHIFLGSHPTQTNLLIREANAKLPRASAVCPPPIDSTARSESQVADSDFGQTPASWARNPISVRTVFVCVTTLLTPLVVAGVWWWSIRATQDTQQSVVVYDTSSKVTGEQFLVASGTNANEPTPQTTVDSAAATISAATTNDLATAGSAKTDIATSEPHRSSNDSASTRSSETVVQKSLYWILLRHDESNDLFRLGSGIAIAPNVILTSGSIVQAITDMTRNGFSDPTVVELSTGRQRKVAKSTAAPLFRQRARNASELLSEYDRLRDPEAANASPPDQHARTKKAEQVNLALSMAAAADVGWLQVPDVSVFVPIESGVHFRPGQSINAVAADFDRRDPFFESDEPAEIHDRLFRVTGRGPAIENVPGTLELDAGAEPCEGRNLIGTPIVRAGRLIGMIVFQSDSSDQVSVAMEAVTSDFIAQVTQTFEHH